MTYSKRDTLFLFLDESGNLDFSSNGTRYWSLTSFCTFHPSEGKQELLDLLYTLADNGSGQEYFHATEDRQAVRDEVFRLIGGLARDYEIHSVLAEKRKASPSLYRKQARRKGQVVLEKDYTGIYGVVCKALLRYVFRCPRFEKAEKVVVVLSSIFDKKKHESIEKALVTELSGHAKIPFHIYFRQNKSDLNCQLADYCGWAIYRKWESQDERSYGLIASHVRNEFDVFRRSERFHY